MSRQEFEEKHGNYIAVIMGEGSRLSLVNACNSGDYLEGIQK